MIPEGRDPYTEIPSLAYIHAKWPDHATARLEESRLAVLAFIKQVILVCPTCQGHKRLGWFLSSASSRPGAVYDCPDCKGTGSVVLPVTDLWCAQGGWLCCPYCFMGQHAQGPDEPCPVCAWWLDVLTETQGEKSCSNTRDQS